MRLIERLKAAWKAFKQSESSPVKSDLRDEVERIKDRIRQNKPISFGEALETFPEDSIFRLNSDIVKAFSPAQLDNRPARIKEFDKYRDHLIVEPEAVADRLQELDEAFPSSVIPRAHVYTQDDYEAIGTYLSMQPELRLDWLHNTTELDITPKDGFLWKFKSKFLMTGERGNPSAAAIAHQVKKFIVDARRPEAERYYTLQNAGNQSIARWDGRLHTIRCDSDPKIEAKCMAELPIVEVQNG